MGHLGCLASQLSVPVIWSHWLIDWLIDGLIDWLMDWLIDRLIDWLNDVYWQNQPTNLSTHVNQLVSDKLGTVYLCIKQFPQPSSYSSKMYSDKHLCLCHCTTCMLITKTNGLLFCKSYRYSLGTCLKTVSPDIGLEGLSNITIWRLSLELCKPIQFYSLVFTVDVNSGIQIVSYTQ